MRGFLFYISIAHDFRCDGASEMLGAGGQKRVPERFLKDWRTALPPLDTQKRIAAFLDEKTAQIDGLIEKKRALLDRLAEKRQAIITQAVTKGLNPTTLMKDSGIDWLGQIPAHWEVNRLKFLVVRPLRYGANAPADWDDPSWPRFVRITDVDSNGSLRPETFRSLPPEIGSQFTLDKGDILLARSGATVGKSFIYRPGWGEACFAGYLVQARISQKNDADFIYQYMNSGAFWSWASVNFIQSTIQNISAEKYANLIVPRPPLSEQHEIVSFAMANLALLDDQNRLVSQSIDQLTEYRCALITAAVTGQIQGLR
jgi:type I restriction enzyme, S subunit